MQKKNRRTTALFKPGDQVLTQSKFNKNSWMPGLVVSEAKFGARSDNVYNVKRANGITAVNVDQKYMKLNEDPSTYVHASSFINSEEIDQEIVNA